MKISLNWLKDYVDFNGSVAELEDIFMRAGMPVEEVKQVGDDWMLDVEVTSNRGDCLGHIGLAREVAAATGSELKVPSVEFKTGTKTADSLVKVVNQSKGQCKRYTARVIEGVKVGPSPDWMQKRLETIGLRSVNNAVDITNYVMMEVGQPLHAFDYNKVAGATIIVRHSENEQMQMIDHSSHKFDTDSLFICDENGPVALAGIMGGCASEVSDVTANVLLESAWFNPLSIRRTARKYVLSSDSSYRFERNVDIWGADWASRRAISLLQQLCGGTIAAGMVDNWEKDQPETVSTTLRMSRLNMLTGIKFEPQRAVDILSSLGFAPSYNSQTDAIACQIPSWRRGDATREADMIEEIIRIHGFAHIPTDEKIHIKVKQPDMFQKTRRQICTALNGVGYFETISVSFIDDGQWQLFAAAGEPISVLNQTRRANNTLRPSLLPSLLTIARTNQDAGNGRCNIFEIATTYQKNAGKTGEASRLALLTNGDFRYLRGAVEQCVRAIDKRAEVVCRPASVKWAGADAGAEFVVGDKVIGYAGLIADNVKTAFGLDKAVAVAELDFTALTAMQGRVPTCQPILRFPAIVRDLSLVLEEGISWSEVEQAIRSANIEDMREVNFVDIYRGKGIDKGMKSLTLSITFKKADGTLTHETAEDYQAKVLNILKDKFKAELRAV
ncbi:MAG: phenylalanine--tRNA ligase subunit beta [Sedimentisphaerales bacterium]|nr:phenylalanine--tRNA ligase subunit beta [Sedimentisphaerales bacterium]MBN2842090.1 phenylalanine--tRNA ligase subunit beta [Sedimentisphaerales bacterium]